MTSPLLIPDLLGLADRVEKLTGPDRSVDYLIFVATAELERPNHWHPTEGNRFTASIDAAMTLVPKGWWWRAGECSVSSDATVGPDVAHCPKDMLIKFDEGFDVVIEPPSSAALALCVAALRARSATP